MNCIILLISCLFVCFTPSYGNSNAFKWPFKFIASHLPNGDSLKSIRMNSGDIISCPGHFLLSTGPSSVIHIIAEKTNDAAHIEEQDVNQMTAYNGCKNLGQGSNGREDSVRLARLQKKYLTGTDTFYDLLTCNCEHWVRYWASGEAISTISPLGQFINESCKVKQLSFQFLESRGCWWTGCQLNTWAVKGCGHYNRWEKNIRDCSGGKVYECCEK